MKVFISEYLQIDLDSEKWHCRVCNHDLGSARENYKEGLLVYERDPREIHKPIIDPERYEYTFSPDPNYIRIIEYYCPECGTMVEVDYLPPGHPLPRDLEFDIDAMKAQWANRTELTQPVLGRETLTQMLEADPHRHGHGHRH